MQSPKKLAAFTAAAFAATMVAGLVDQRFVSAKGGPIERVEEKFHLTGLDRDEYLLSAAGYSTAFALRWSAEAEYVRKTDATDRVTVRVVRPLPLGPWRLDHIGRSGR